jgi:hypothetical protein
LRYALNVFFAKGYDWRIGPDPNETSVRLVPLFSEGHRHVFPLYSYSIHSSLVIQLIHAFVHVLSFIPQPTACPNPVHVLLPIIRRQCLSVGGRMDPALDQELFALSSIVVSHRHASVQSPFVRSTVFVRGKKDECPTRHGSNSQGLLLRVVVG